jgi:hypothetical protein
LSIFLIEEADMPDAKAATTPQGPKPRLLCTQPRPKPIVLPSGLSQGRAFAIRLSAKKWVNGTVLHYCFIDEAQEPAWKWVDAQKNMVRWAAKVWMDLDIGLSLVEVQDASEAELRFGCLQDDGSWSLVGTDNLDQSYWDRGRTLNYGWDLTTDWGRATAQHELGHAIGLSHEHQSDSAGIVWNIDSVYAFFEAPPNSWSKEVIDSNIIQKLDPSATEGSKWDPKSIMEYPFEPGLIKSPKPYDTLGVGENLVLSDDDKKWVSTWYPPLAPATPIQPMQLAHIDAAAGQQRDFEFVPDATKDYTISLAGHADARIVVFEDRDGEARHLISADDSGQDSSITLNTKLVKGRKYTARVRINYVPTPSPGVGLLVY